MYSNVLLIVTSLAALSLTVQNDVGAQFDTRRLFSNGSAFQFKHN